MRSGVRLRSTRYSDQCATKRQLRTRFTSLMLGERDVFDGIVAGRLNKQIADELAISERTVKAERAFCRTSVCEASSGKTIGATPNCPCALQTHELRKN
ncbi:MAG TPA: LuxR C-terminal-related transcriptional regulator [Candidatus Accumulibacter phosphatis]|nr:MAG: response regulator FixJ [Candidatus Accumulibacter sp. SK-11]HRL75108.1 LuxR C-terminal-related transcriptional regulator [Candidatus Accumulibacter phosphatis]HRQ93879.1 LuxR C-terminal-related transcriptional regulator [Candidatus Accumulibacter phosphatis]